VTRARGSFALLAAGLAVGGLGGWLEGGARFRPWPVLALWLLSIALFLGGAWVLDGGRRRAARLDVARWEWAAIAALTIVALLVRVIALEHLPGNFSGDEGEMGMEARAVLDGVSRDPFTTGWESHPTLWFFLQAASLRVFGDSVLGLRLLSALLGTATVPVLYLYARRPFGARVALAASTLLAVYHFHIHFSRIGLNNIADPPVALLAFACFFEGCRRRSPFLFALSGIFLGVDQHLYFAGRLAPLLIVAVIGQQAVFHRERLLAVARFLPLLFLGLFVGFGPLVRVPLFHWPDFTARLAVEGVFQSGWYHDRIAEGAAPLHVLATQAWDGIGGYGFLSDRSPHYYPGMPLLDSVSNGFFIVGVLVLVAWFRRSEPVLVLGWLLATAAASALVVSSPGSPHYVTASPAICLAIAVGIDAILGRFAANTRLRPWAVGALGATVGALGAWNLNFYFREYSPRDTYAWSPTLTSTAIGHYLAPRTSGAYVSLLGHQWLLLQNGTIRFLAPGMEGADVPEGAAPPTHPARLRQIFIALPDRFGDLGRLEHEFPGGALTDVRGGPDHAVLFRAYRPRQPQPGGVGAGSHSRRRKPAQPSVSRFR
jgi:4-amino-4-deoxy-L-arabinose transferase-like glycosyltransferase